MRAKHSTTDIKWKIRKKLSVPHHFSKSQRLEIHLKGDDNDNAEVPMIPKQETNCIETGSVGRVALQ